MAFVKILSIIIYFVREIIFDTKEERDIKSAKFNSRKFALMVIVILSFLMNLFFMDRIYYMAKKIAVLNDTIAAMQATIDSTTNAAVDQKNQPP